jgi:hypothetical protein
MFLPGPTLLHEAQSPRATMSDDAQAVACSEYVLASCSALSVRSLRLSVDFEGLEPKSSESTPALSHWINRPKPRIIPLSGGMAERPIAPVLKTD